MTTQYKCNDCHEIFTEFTGDFEDCPNCGGDSLMQREIETESEELA